jgi:predicted NAD/FAD-binding protein
MRIGVIGGGISGLAAAWFLQADHAVTVYERSDCLGGHARTVPVVHQGVKVHAEAGFRYFTARSYPYLLAVLRVLGLTPRPARGDLAIVFEGAPTALVLPPRSPRHVWHLLRSARRLRQVLWFDRFRRSGAAVVAARDWSQSLREFVRDQGFPAAFAEEFLYPVVAACWGMPREDMVHFPAYCVLKLMHLAVGRRSTFLQLDGGIGSYIAALARQLGAVDIPPGTGVVRVSRHGGEFLVEDTAGQVRSFDRLVVATSSRDAERLLAGVPGADGWCEVLGRFRHASTTIVIHSDPAFMPPRPADWAVANVFCEGGRSWLTDWPGRDQGVPVFRTWLPPDRPAPREVHYRQQFHHLIVTKESRALQQQIAELQGKGGIWVAGMYVTDADNHDSALASALTVGKALAPHSPKVAEFERALDG